MTKAEAIHGFFAGFGLPAYEEHSVPAYTDAAQTEPTKPPYITYQFASSDFFGGAVALTADVWDLSESWKLVEAVCDAISRAVTPFCRLSCDDGCIVVTKGSPFAQHIGDDVYKRAYLNLYFTFITN